MTDQFFDILMEAKGDKRPSTPTPRPRRIVIDTNRRANSGTDYTEDVPEEEEDDDEEETADQADNEEDGDDEEEESTDYSQDAVELDPEDEESDDEGEDAEGEEDTATDYSEGSEDTGDEQGEEGAEGEGEDADGATDYSEGADGDSTETNSGGDTGETSGGGDTSENPEEQAAEASEKEEKRRLLIDFTDFYNMNKSVINRLTESTRSDVLGNKIINQVKINLIELQSALYDYIVYRYKAAKYVKCLYMYNYFIEAFKINVEMLRKIPKLTSNK